MSASAPAVNSCRIGRQPHRRPRPQTARRRPKGLPAAPRGQRPKGSTADVHRRRDLRRPSQRCAKYLLTKGRAIAVTGRLVYREWDDNGTRRSKHHIIGRVQFGGKPTSRPAESADSHN